MNRLFSLTCLIPLVVKAFAAGDADASASRRDAAEITVFANQPGHRLSRYLTGACLEDVNHEVYGGLWSQMIFGESFQEPAPAAPLKGFKAHGGGWTVTDGELEGDPGEGPKLVADALTLGSGSVGVEVLLPDRKPGNAGLIVRVAKPGPGADNFDGYEVSLDASAQIVRLGRHRHNWELIQDTPCDVTPGRWIPLEVRMTGTKLEVWVDGQRRVQHDDGPSALPAGEIGLRQWQRAARYRNLWTQTDGKRRDLAFLKSAEDRPEVSGPWRFVQRGGALGTAALVRNHPFVGTQCQRLTFDRGLGEIGVENQGLNRWGMHFVGHKSYEGVLWVRTASPAELWVALEHADGSAVLAEQRLRLAAGLRRGRSEPEWQKLEFKLRPDATEARGRFVIKLKQPGSVDLGYALLEPGAWGRFKNLPVRRDVAEALVDQGITVLRYGGSMINHPEYRWKNMVGPRETRPPTAGTWYPKSSNGWGILEFLDFCEAAGFLAIPAFNLEEKPEDMADFVEYVNGPATSAWGRRRAAAGHPAPYRLRHLELGNEERVDANYFTKFKPLAQALWAKDPDLVLVVGDFVYTQPIRDPFQFQGSVVGLTNLLAHQHIIELARAHNREVWFDLHVGTDGPRPDASFAGMLSFIDALERVAGGAKHKVAVFEFNAGNHQQRRALANALAIQAIERDGRIPVATSANCLQPDGQNDNGWDQGLLFLNPRQVWLQPPGWVTRMVSRHYQPLHLPCQIEGNNQLDVSAKRSEDGRIVVVQVVNLSDQAVATQLNLCGFRPTHPTAKIEELAGALEARNSADEPNRIVPHTTSWKHSLPAGEARRSFPPHSFTVLRFVGTTTSDSPGLGPHRQTHR